MIMIFLRTCESTRLLALMLRNLSFNAISISGQMSQDKRLGALNRFKAKECKILTCTDVASRGLDIQGVDMDYVHQVGRTARAGESGCAVSLVNQYEAMWFKMVEQQLGKVICLSVANKDVIEMHESRVATSKSIALKSLKESGGFKKRTDKLQEQTTKRSYGYRNRTECGTCNYVICCF